MGLVNGTFARAAEIQVAAKSSDSGQNPGSVSVSRSISASKPASADSKADARTLIALSSEEVEAALGKPTGKLQTADGALWLYADWRVQFDHRGRVLKVEKDQPIRLAKLDPQFVAAADAVAKGAADRAKADDGARIRAAAHQEDRIKIISNGGEEVDLASLLTPGKITIVDFYADWCGPCKRLSPHLEKLAKNDPDILLLKIDIVNWGTPVVRQFGIQSVPHVRVFNRTRTQMGEATYDVDLVMEQLKQAKGP